MLLLTNFRSYLILQKSIFQGRFVILVIHIVASPLTGWYLDLLTLEGLQEKLLKSKNLCITDGRVSQNIRVSDPNGKQLCTVRC